MKRLIVTGSTGLLGRMIVKVASNDYIVIPLYRTRPLHTDSTRLDITDGNEVLRLFQELDPYAVIHTASETNVDKCETEKEHSWRINVEGTHNIAFACSEVGTKLVYISTDYVFDGEKGNYDEEDKPNPINYYGLTKLEGENQVIQHCKNYAILRTSVLYGWHPWKQNFVTWTINQLKQDKEITVVRDHYNTPTLANNLAEMALEIVQKDIRGLYHASGKERISRYEFALQIARIFELDVGLIRPIEMSRLVAWVARRPKDSSLNIEKIQKELETRSLNVDEGLDRMKKEAGR